MEKEVKRWSLPIDRTQELKDLFPDLEYSPSKYLFNSLDSLLEKIDHRAGHFEYVVDAMKKANYNKKVCVDEMSEFYFDFYYSTHPENKYGNYIAEGEVLHVYRILSILTKKGYDVREQWRTFRQLLKDLWVLLPDFYKGDLIYFIDRGQPERSVSAPPAGYDPEKPYPDLEIPQDIDE